MKLIIEQERIKRGWTLDYIGEYTGLTKSAVSRIINGQNKPSYEVLVRLEDLFNLPHRQLFAVVDDTRNLTSTL